MVWAGPRRVVLFIGRPIGVDVRTGRTFRASERYFETRSRDGRFVVETAASGSEFEVRVLRIDGSGSTTYGRVPGCFDDLAYVAALQSLQFVPGRKSLVFESYCPEPPSDLFAVSPDSAALTKLTGGGKQYGAPSWSPDGTHIAYSRFDHTGLSCKGCPGSIWVADADGTNARLLVPGNESSGESALLPSWSPDGTRILFTRTSFTQAEELFVVAASGGTPSDVHISGSDATWGPSRIAWVDFQSSPASLWTAKPDGTDRLKIAGGNVSSPAWATDGRLAYLDGKATVVVVGGGSPQRVQLPLAEVTSLAWSPDGTRFVIGARAVGTAAPDIYTLRTDGTDVRRLTTDLDAGSPSWR
jgi:Tol biopolymer transport system component